MPLLADAQLGAYVIVAPIGAGGMSEVYRARDTRLDRDVAIKVLPQAVAADPHARARFEREAKAIAALSHPNILAIHDFGVDGSIVFAVTELLDGATLRDISPQGRSRRVKRLSWPCKSRMASPRRTTRGRTSRPSSRQRLIIRDVNRFWMTFGQAAPSR